MTDERTTTTARADGKPAEGTAVEGVATPVDEEPDPPGDGPELAAWARRVLDGVRPGSVIEALRGSDSTADGPVDWLLQFAVWTVAVLGYVLLFGVAVGGVVITYEFLGTAVAPEVESRLALTGLLLVPVLTFAFVAAFADADPVVPEWSGEHPPLVDAWLLVVAMVAGATLATLPHVSGGPVLLWGVGASLLTAYLVLPVWLARRCLRRPRWSLGGLTLLAGPLVLLVGGVSLAEGRVYGGDPWLALVTTIVGIALSFGLAHASPGPAVLAEHLASAIARTGAVLRNAGAVLRAAPARLLGRHGE